MKEEKQMKMKGMKKVLSLALAAVLTAAVLPVGNGGDEGLRCRCDGSRL